MFLLYHHFLRLKSLRGSHPFLQPSQDGVVSSRAEPQKEDELQEGQDVTNQRHLFCPQLRKGWDSAWLNQMHWFLRKSKLCMKFIIQLHCFSQIDLEPILQCLPTWEAHQAGGFWRSSWFKVTGKFIKNKSLSPRNVEWKNHKNPRYWMGLSVWFPVDFPWNTSSVFPLKRQGAGHPPATSRPSWGPWRSRPRSRQALGLTSMWVKQCQSFLPPMTGNGKFLPPIYIYIWWFGGWVCDIKFYPHDWGTFFSRFMALP